MCGYLELPNNCIHSSLEKHVVLQFMELCHYLPAVNLFLERQHTAERFAEGSILMYIRPLKIGPRKVSGHFCKFVPPEE